MNLLPVTQFAAAEESSGDLMSTLGIDWATLIFQIVAFLILLFLLKKFVYPWLMKSVDERQADIEAASHAATEAQAAAADAEDRVAKLLKKARGDAADIVATAKLESAAALDASEQKAQRRADQLVADAQAEISKEVLAAKKALYNETLDLVTMATANIVGKVVTKEVDASLINDAIKAVK